MQPHTWITGWPNPLLVRAMSYQSCCCFTAIHRVKGCAASLAKVPHLQVTEELTLQWHKLRHPWKSCTKGELRHAVYNLTLKKTIILTENTLMLYHQKSWHIQILKITVDEYIIQFLYHVDSGKHSNAICIQRQCFKDTLDPDHKFHLHEACLIHPSVRVV